MLSAITLRQLWLIIEQTQTQTLLELSTRELSSKLQEQLKQQSCLSSAELIAVEGTPFARARLGMVSS